MLKPVTVWDIYMLNITFSYYFLKKAEFYEKIHKTVWNI